MPIFLLKLKDFSRLQAITWYLGNSVRQRRYTSDHYIGSDLTYQLVASPMTLGDLQAFTDAIFRTVVKQLTIFRLTQRLAWSLCDSPPSSLTTERG